VVTPYVSLVFPAQKLPGNLITPQHYNPPALNSQEQHKKLFQTTLGSFGRFCLLVEGFWPVGLVFADLQHPSLGYLYTRIGSGGTTG